MSFTDRPVRFIGYGAAFGESARPLADNDIVVALYSIGALFVIAHCMATMIDTSNPLAVLDVLIFELIASVFIPLGIAHFVMRVTERLLDRLRVNYDIQEYAPTIICILTLILVSQPLDELVNKLMDDSIRKVLK
jgi:hypothetical protein